ncbi:MAG: AMP-binding protein [Alphaproteobacteria bacterium]
MTTKPESRTAPDLLAEMARRHPEAEAVVDGGLRWSYATLHAEARAAAKGLSALGVARGDRVAILMGNRAEWLSVEFGAMMLGAIAVALNTWASGAELAHQLADSGTRVIVLEPRHRDTDLLQRVREARATTELPALEHVVVVDPEEAFADVVDHDEMLLAGTAIEEADIAEAEARVRPEDPACLLYTSGSTALPKGVPLHHRGLIDNMWEIGERQHLGPHDRLWLAVSLFWSFGGVNAVFALLTHGGAIVLQPHFDAGRALRLIERERCSVFYGTPNMALAMHEHPERASRDLSSLRTGVTIGTPEQVMRIVELGAGEICNAYGLTEAFGNSAVTDCRMALERRIACSGPPLGGVELRIVDPESEVPRAVGEVGEIRVMGNLMAGYWNDPARTAEAFDGEGFHKTGDLGVLDEAGNLVFRGRLKEMVKTGGINVAPAEVEDALRRHEDVELAFVTGLPDDRLDEALAAVIVPRGDARPDENALKAHCRERLAAYKVPRHFRFVEASALPLTSTGKLEKRRLPELFG